MYCFQKREKPLRMNMQRVKNEKNMFILFQAKEIGPTTPIIYVLLEAEWITTCLWNALRYILAAYISKSIHYFQGFFLPSSYDLNNGVGGSNPKR